MTDLVLVEHPQILPSDRGNLLACNFHFLNLSRHNATHVSTTTVGNPAAFSDRSSYWTRAAMRLAYLSTVLSIADVLLHQTFQIFNVLRISTGTSFVNIQISMCLDVYKMLCLIISHFAIWWSHSYQTTTSKMKLISLFIEARVTCLLKKGENIRGHSFK